MSVRSLLLRGGATVAAGQMIAKLLSLVRNVIVARLISRTDFGIAATFFVIATLIDSLSDLGVGMMVVQSPDAEDPRFISTAQSIVALRGIINSAILFLLAHPIASLFQEQEATWAFRWLALYPIIRSLVHLDIGRMQREMNFAPSVLQQIGSQFVSLLMAWPLAAWLRNYSALLWLSLAQDAAATILSILLARRPYHWSWHGPYVRKIFAFGLPLLVTGVTMFCVFQGDRAVIGSASTYFSKAHYSKADLGSYSAAASLALVLGSGIASMCVPLLLPVLSKAQTDEARFKRRYAFTIQSLAVLGGVIGIPCILGGQHIIDILYGQRYADAGVLLMWLGASTSFRVLRTAPLLAGIARGDTVNTMISNLVRATSLAGAIVIAFCGGPMWTMCAAGLAAEFLAGLASIVHLRIRHGLSVWIGFRPVALVSVCLLIAGAAERSGLGVARLPVSILACLVGTILMILAAIAAFPAVRSEIHIAATAFRRMSAVRI